MPRRIRVFIVLTVISTMLLSGCTARTPASSTETATPQPATTETAVAETTEAVPEPVATIDREPYEFTILVNYDWYSPPRDWGTDEVSKTLSDMFQIKINWVGSGGNPNDKIATMLASDDLPDSIILEKDASYLKLIELGKLVQIDEYIAKYTNYRSVVSDETRKMSAVDGKIYAVLNWPTNQPNGNGGWIVNTSVYDQVGKPELKTLDQLYSYLKAVKDAGIKEGGADVVPLQLGAQLDFGQLYVAYEENRVTDYFNRRAWVNPTTQSFEFIGKDPKFTDMMLFMQKLYNEGLINQDIFIEQQDQIKEKCANGRFAIVTSNNVTGYPLAGLSIWKQTTNEQKFNIIEPLGVSGDHTKVYSNTYNTLGWNALCITTNAAKPERIYEYYDYISSNEGQTLIEYGPKGELWDTLDESGYPIYKDPNADITPEESNRLGLWSWVWPGMTAFTDNSKTAANARKPLENQDVGALFQSTVTWKHSWNATEFTNLDAPGDSEEGIAWKAVDDLFKEYLPKIIGAKSPEEATAFIAEMNVKADENGFDKTANYFTKVWKENLAKMGK